MKFQDDGASVRVSKKWFPLFDRLCARGAEASEDLVLFEQMTGLWTLAAAIGVRQQRRVALQQNDARFKWQNFNSETEKPVLAALAWSVSGHDTAVLSSARAILDCLEEYVEGGLEFLAEDVLADCFAPDGSFEVKKTQHLELAILALALELGEKAPI